jgi:hypothetical protein
VVWVLLCAGVHSVELPLEEYLVHLLLALAIGLFPL